MKKIDPRLSLVGAGPGDPDLITVKGIKTLAEADVVLYDALANKDLLKHAPAKAKLIFVGKRAGQHYKQQDEINRLIVKHALQDGHVVRLKGGDPFIFGRGYEELEYAESFGIESSVVPGISSTYSVPELIKLPLTSRGLSDSFWVLTGTTRAGELSNDLKLAAQSNATVVILMGVKQLSKIVTLFTDHGKSTTPVAIIQNGSTSKQRIGVGTISTIKSVVEEENIGSPAVIVVGEVVSVLLKVDFQKLQVEVKNNNERNG